jgi:hypothetical protein
MLFKRRRKDICAKQWTRSPSQLTSHSITRNLCTHSGAARQQRIRSDDQTKHNPSLEQDLPTMLGLEAKSLQLIVTLLVALFPLILFLLLQFEDFLERSLDHGRWEVVFAVEILNDYPSTYVP